MSALYRLRAYLSSSDESLLAFGRRTAVDPVHILEAAEGRRALTLVEARRVEAASDGAVASEDLIQAPGGASAEVSDLANRRKRGVSATSGGNILPDDFASMLRPELVRAVGVRDGEATALVNLACDAVRHTTLAVAADSAAARAEVLPRVLRLVLTEILEEFAANRDRPEGPNRQAAEISNRILGGARY
ncbi:MAG: hypothetical protein GC152_11630 [Alphaproteobacteria bacterium]|nr:hypothetical protein [Alphaproteobacteria bacterium]